MDFATWYMKTVGIPLEEAKARGVADLELMEQCFVESKAAERKRWRSAVLGMRERLLWLDQRADTREVDALLAGPNGPGELPASGGSARPGG